MLQLVSKIRLYQDNEFQSEVKHFALEIRFYELQVDLSFQKRSARINEVLTPVSFGLQEIAISTTLGISSRRSNLLWKLRKLLADNYPKFQDHSNKITEI